MNYALIACKTLIQGYDKEEYLVLSLFAVYVDELLHLLSASKIGCFISNM